MTDFQSPAISTTRALREDGWRRTLALAVAGVFMAAQVHAHSHAPAQPGDQKAAATAAQPDAHTRADIERHRSMAKAHEAAAQCLAHGGEHEKCEKQLQADCKGLALGKYCGMRHAH